MTRLLNKLSDGTLFSIAVWRRKLRDLRRAAQERREVRDICLQKDGTAPRAETYYFDVTNQCNLRCEMCYLRDVLNKKVKGGALTNEEFLHIIERDGIKKVNLIGGEPFLRKDLPELLDEFERRGILCESLTTNGTMITEERAAQLAHLVSLGLMNGITFSIDGPSDIHDAVRGKGTFDKAAEGIRILSDRLHRAGGGAIDRLVLNSVICPQNYEMIDNVADVAKRLGVRNICLCHLMYTTPDDVAQTNRILKNDGPDVFQMYVTSDPGMDIQALGKALGHFRRKAARYGIHAMTRPNIPDELIEKTYSPDYAPPGCCMQPFFVTRVGTDAKVYYCTFIRKEMGNLRHQSIQEIWNSERFVADRRLMIRRGIFPVCKRCCKMFLRR